MLTRTAASDFARSAFRLIRLLLVGLGLLMVLVTLTPLDRWWAAALAGPWDDTKGDVLIVLAGSCLATGIIGEISQWRSVSTGLAWKADGFKQIVLSGGPPGRPCAGAMASFLAAEGVPSTSIIVESRSTSTRGNALFTIPIIQGLGGRKVLMRSDYHMFRASRTSRKLGVDLSPRPMPDALKRAESLRARWSAFLGLMQETVKIIYYRARGWI